MYIYSLCMSYEVEDFEIGFDFEYLMHEKMYSKNEFYNICNECLSKCLDKCNYELKEKLISDYGFRKLDITSNFNFNEDCR